VPDGDHKIDPDEHVQLAELDPFHVIEIPGREQHHEQGRTVPLQLGPLMRRDRILHRQLVQLELGGHRPDLRHSGRYNPIQAIPFRSRST